MPGQIRGLLKGIIGNGMGKMEPGANAGYGSNIAPGIVCTLGTTTDPQEVLTQMVVSGMTAARINTAYADLHDYERRIGQLRDIAPIPVMMDIKGPQLRLLSDRPYRIEKEDIISVGFADEQIHFNNDFYQDVFVGDRLYIENGTIEARIVGKRGHEVQIRIIEPGEGQIRKQMGVNVPGKILSVPRLTEKDEKVIEFSVARGIEYIALSFVQSYEDLQGLQGRIEYYQDLRKGAEPVYGKEVQEGDAQKRLTQDGEGLEAANRERARRERGYAGKPNIPSCPSIGIIAKIEDEVGMQNLEDILKRAGQDRMPLSVMIARGDLYVERPAEELPYDQEYIVRKCRQYGVPVILATGVLESMQYQSRPTRAEVNDVYLGLKEGVDAFMFSGETSNGRQPALAVMQLKKIIDLYAETVKRQCS